MVLKLITLPPEPLKPSTAAWVARNRPEHIDAELAVNLVLGHGFEGTEREDSRIVDAKTFASEGAAVAVNYASSYADADRVVGEIVQAGGKAAAIKADVSKRADVQREARPALDPGRDRPARLR